MITSKQRAYLRGMSNTMQPIFQIGKGGVSDEIIKQLGNALEARELIKITILESCDETPKELAPALMRSLKCEIVSILGSKMVLYKESKKHKRIDLNV